MLAFVEFSPLLAFGIAYWLGDVYLATAVLMAAMVVALLLGWWIDPLGDRRGRRGLRGGFRGHLGAA